MKSTQASRINPHGSAPYHVANVKYYKRMCQCSSVQAGSKWGSVQALTARNIQQWQLMNKRSAHWKVDAKAADWEDVFQYNDIYIKQSKNVQVCVGRKSNQAFSEKQFRTCHNVSTRGNPLVPLVATLWHICLYTMSPYSNNRSNPRQA
jgi:hypothetical protein